MLHVYFLISLLFFNCKCEINITYKDQPKKSDLIKCIANTVGMYLSEHKEFTYVGVNSDDDELLKAIHLKTVASLSLRQPQFTGMRKHMGYLITANTVINFTESLEDLPKDRWWNPTARFVIIISSLKENELRKVFDALLKRHVINVLVVNGTDHAHLYTYNPFDNYACGRYYSDVISFGMCSQTTNNLFPDKLVTGLRNCTFNAAVKHIPPFTKKRTKTPKHHRIEIGAEQHIFELLAQTEQFKVNYSYYDDKTYDTIQSGMRILGPMSKLQNNETDVMFGAKVLVSKRMQALTYLHGYMDFVDKLLFFVKRASTVPIWKNLYLEFEGLVWLLLLFVFLIFSTLIIIMVRAEDKTEIMLKLLQHLLSHGCNMPYRTSVKFVFIIWVWFAYIMSSLYQSSLVSLTAHPIKEFQVSTELELVKRRLLACITDRKMEYILSEINKSSNVINYGDLDPIKNMKMVGDPRNNMFTLYEHSQYTYNKKLFCDEYGNSRVYYFKRPYANLIYAMFFYKGFPLTDRMRKNAIRFKESGIVVKSLKDHYYAKKIRRNFRDEDIKPNFRIPWIVYGVGCVLAMATFIAEVLSYHYDKSS